MIGTFLFCFVVFFRNSVGAAWTSATSGYSSYEGISPSRSPGGSAGPTYTQLSSSGGAGRSAQPPNVAGYHQNTGIIIILSSR